MTLKEYRLDIKIKNNLIAQKIDDLGFQSISQFCRTYALSQQSIGALINMTISPLLATGRYRKDVYELCDIFQCTPDEIFSDEQMNKVFETNKYHVAVSKAEAQFYLENREELLGLEQTIDKINLSSVLMEQLNTLTLREKKIMSLLYLDGLSRSEVGELFDISTNRICQIEQKSLRKLRHPARANKIKAYTEID